MMILISDNLKLNVLQMWFGIFLIALAIYFFLFAKRIRLKKTNTAGVLCGVFSGVTAGLFSIGGPLMALYYVTVTDDRETYTADMQTIFTLNTSLSLITHASRGHYSWHMIPFTLLGIVGILIGKRVGWKIGGSIDKETFKKVVYVFVALSGIVTVLQSI